MNSTLETIWEAQRVSAERKKYDYPPAPEQFDYPPAVEDEMGETAVHYKQIALLFSLLEKFFASRDEVLVAANMTVYYDENARANWYAPDVFVCFGVDKRERRSFTSYKEGVFPQVVFEVASESTADVDMDKKFNEYNRLGAKEYYLLDPERAYLPQPLMAYQSEDDSGLLAVKVEDGRVFSPLLGLEIVDTGNTFRLFDNLSQEFLLTLDEAADGLEIVEEKLEVTEANLRETEAELREAEAEIARLRELLKQK